VDREAEWNRIKQQFPNSTTEKAKVSKKRKKPMRTEEGSAYSKAFTRVKGCLFSMRPEQAYLDAYEGGGWGGHSHNKIKPEAELRSARMKIRRAKGRIREVMQSLKGEYPKGVRINEDQIDDDGIDAEGIVCCVCGGEGCDEVGNDILLCDAKGCHRAFHQQCITPPPTKEELGGEDDDWFCQTCECRLDILDLVSDEFGIEVQSDSELFPELETEDPDKPREESSSDDGDFNPEQEDADGDGASSSSSSSSDEEGAEQKERGSEGEAEDVDIEPGELQALQMEAAVAGAEEETNNAKGKEKEEEEVDVENMGRGKRERKTVDYVKLAEEDAMMVCMMSDDEADHGEWKEGASDDDDFTVGFYQAMRT